MGQPQSNSTRISLPYVLIEVASNKRFNLFDQMELGREGFNNDESISRRHCLVWWDRDSHQICVMDLGSSNGTFINGNRLPPQQTHVLRQGDELRLGNSSFHFSSIEKANNPQPAQPPVTNERIVYVEAVTNGVFYFYSFVSVGLLFCITIYYLTSLRISPIYSLGSSFFAEWLLCAICSASSIYYLHKSIFNRKKNFVVKIGHYFLASLISWGIYIPCELVFLPAAKIHVNFVSHYCVKEPDAKLCEVHTKALKGNNTYQKAIPADHQETFQKLFRKYDRSTAGIKEL